MASPDEFYNGNLDLFLKRRLPAYIVFELGLSPNTGLKEFPRAIMFMPQSVLKKAVEKHAIDLNYLKDLPSLICGLVALYKSKTVANSFVIQLPCKWANEYLVVAAEHVNHADFGTSYMVKSIHTRPDDQFDNWKKDALLLFEK